MPTEIHEHYSEHGVKVGETRIVRESPWDDLERDRAEALDAAEDLMCPMCGNLRSVCSNPDLDWYPQRSVCWATAAQERVMRGWAAKHNGEPVEPAMDPKPTDGTHLWVSQADLTPDDDFL